MIRIDRLIMVQAIAIASAMVAAVIGGLLAESWIWAIAYAIFVYGGFQVAVMFGVSRQIRTAVGWRDLRDSARDDDDDANDGDWDHRPNQDVYGQQDRDWGEDVFRLLGSRDRGRRAIE